MRHSVPGEPPAGTPVVIAVAAFSRPVRPRTLGAMRVCGVDPGLERTGYAVLDGAGGRPVVVDAGVITTSRSAALPARLVEIADAWAGVLEEHAPTVVAVERLFAHYKHPRTAIQMGHARGVILETAARRGTTVVHLAATEVKRATTGNGRASKAQMQRAIQVTLGLSTLPEPADVADALAIALCALERSATAGAMQAPDHADRFA